MDIFIANINDLHRQLNTLITNTSTIYSESDNKVQIEKLLENLEGLTSQIKIIGHKQTRALHSLELIREDIQRIYDRLSANQKTCCSII